MKGQEFKVLYVGKKDSHAPSKFLEDLGECVEITNARDAKRAIDSGNYKNMFLEDISVAFESGNPKNSLVGLNLIKYASKRNIKTVVLIKNPKIFKTVENAGANSIIRTPCAPVKYLRAVGAVFNT